MSAKHIFISHASKDDGFVEDLRVALQAQGLQAWVDSRDLVAGNKLAPEIEQAIEEARQFIVVLSPETINSRWVRKEIRKALEVEQQRKAEDYRVIPLLLPGIQPSALESWFDEEPVALSVQLRPGDLSEMLPEILAALGERLPDDHQGQRVITPQPIEDLLLKLSDIKIAVEGGARRVVATATLAYEPADRSVRKVESKRFMFTAPFGLIETEEIRWYLERYHLWPVGVFRERAQRVEAQLPTWGKALYDAALSASTAQTILAAWKQAAAHGEGRFSIFVDSDPPEGMKEADEQAARLAASALLALPWELLYDGSGYLFQGKHPVRVRRQLPNRRPQAAFTTDLPIRVLLVSPRPEDEHTGYFDHRSSALPLVDAFESLGELVELTVLTPPTFPALLATLKAAVDAGQPFDVVHFDGHGVYDPEHGLGGLCFEDPNDEQKIVQRRMQSIDAGRIAAEIRDYRIPLVFLDACQTAKVEDDPTASVATRLLEEGVTSVVAMSHSVLVPTAERFVKAFYEKLAHGARIGAAMLAGQQALHSDSYRLKIMGAGELHLQDWFVPVLYQEQLDPQLIGRLPAQVEDIQARRRQTMLGELPPAPPHHFQGRSRELLALERLLHTQPYAVLRGQGGAGKTTLAVELARWLVRSGRFKRAAFVSVEQSGDARTVLDAIGRQLVPSYSVAQYSSQDGDLKQALQPVESALRDVPTLIVVDNMESVLPDASGQSAAAAPVEELFALCQSLLAAHPATRLLFTSREALPAPFDARARMVELGALSREDAIELVSQVMAQEGLVPEASDPGGTAEEITELVEAVNRHARALVLLAREVARRGVRSTTGDLRQLMAELHQKNPNDRENSLYASVELSLRRLTPEQRQQVRKLGVFHSGGHLNIIARVLDVDIETGRALAISLINVGVAEDMGYGHLRLDPALPSYLLNQLSEDEQQEAREQWAQGMIGLTQFLYQQQFQDAQLAAHLTLLELSNLLALLAWIQEKLPPEQVVDVAGSIEQLLANLDRPQALAQVVAVREQVAKQLNEWGVVHFGARRLEIERLLQRGDMPAAYQAAQQLLQRSFDAGEEAYKGAAYDLAMAYDLVGEVLARSGAAEEALKYFAQAKQRFQILADTDDQNAMRMAAIVIGKTVRCFDSLGRLDESAAASEDAINQFQKLNDKRSIAVAKGNLGNVRMLQGHDEEALKAYAEARDIFASLSEPRMVAAAWHQIGIVHRQAKYFDQAEQAYRQSLAIKVQLKDRAGEASSLSELGTLYDELGRLEEAAIFYQQASDIDIDLRDIYNEGLDRSNLANTLITLKRYDEARRELHRAIECKKLYGHAALPWTTWELLRQVEQATNNPQAAAQARQQAIHTYVDYRRAGGESQSTSGQLCAATLHAIRQNQAVQAEQQLAQLLQSDLPQGAKLLISKLQAILGGDRDPALADDPELSYTSVVELQLLLEALANQAQE
jgi:tetratricopeptide (TPR) repeat protein